MHPAEHAARFRALDGMRGLFAVAVAALHCNVYGYFYDLPLVRSGYLAVDFFFVLSGFVIAHASLSRLDSWRSVGTFVVRRFGRVWPLHAVMLVCFVALELMKWLAVARGAQADSLPFGTPQTDPLAIPAHLLLVHALNLFPSNTWNSPSWSISTEFYTYIVFAVCTLLLRRWLVLVALLWIGLSALGLFRQVDSMDTTYDWAMLRCLFGFFVGYLTYRIHRQFPAPRAGGSLVELGLLTATALFMAHTAQNQLSILAPLVFAVSIWYFASERGALSRALRSAPLAALGRWSYAIYMVHELVFLMLMRGFRALSRVLHADMFIVDDWSRLHDTVVLLSFGQRWWMDAIALLAVALSVGVAYLANRFIELPAQAYFQRRAKQFDARASERPDGAVLVAPTRESFP
jgi:peptidoglycan/LPS O-acetylase OafA/YrhL